MTLLKSFVSIREGSAHALASQMPGRSVLFGSALISLVLFSGSALAQTSGDRNVNQQQRIEQGLQSGELSTREASKLERTESRVDAVQAKAMKDGVVTQQEAARIDKSQDIASKQIYAQKHDKQTGNPDSASSNRMQADVQRNINQQQRIDAGVKSGALTTQEAARMQANQAQAEHREAHAGRDGKVTAREQGKIQHKESRDSRKIHRQKHD